MELLQRGVSEKRRRISTVAWFKDHFTARSRARLLNYIGGHFGIRDRTDDILTEMAGRGWGVRGRGRG